MCLSTSHLEKPLTSYDARAGLRFFGIFVDRRTEISAHLCKYANTLGYLQTDSSPMPVDRCTQYRQTDDPKSLWTVLLKSLNVAGL